MTVINGVTLFRRQPVSPMMQDKRVTNGITHGLGEAGYDIRIAQNVTLHPFRRFRLVSSVERFRMPEDLIGIVHDKSSWARRGLSVFNTVIEPGWKGYLTLELVYHGWIPLSIEAGTGIAQVVFHILENRAAYNGKYQHQPNRPVEAL